MAGRSAAAERRAARTSPLGGGGGDPRTSTPVRPHSFLEQGGRTPALSGLCFGLPLFLLGVVKRLENEKVFSDYEEKRTLVKNLGNAEISQEVNKKSL